MSQVRVNLTIDESVWRRFSSLMPQRKKSRYINNLIRKEIDRIEKENEEKELVAGFREASLDKDRSEELREWNVLDTEGWE